LVIVFFFAFFAPELKKYSCGFFVEMTKKGLLFAFYSHRSESKSKKKIGFLGQGELSQTSTLPEATHGHS
jgi:hypothetical protein